MYPGTAILLMLFILLYTTAVKAEEVWTVIQNKVPGWVISDTKGPLIQFIKEVSREAGIKAIIKIAPTRRAHWSVFNRKADMHFGFMEPPDEMIRDSLPVRFSKLSLSHLNLYIYSKKKLDLSNMKKLRLVISAGYDKLFRLPLKSSNCRDCAFQRVDLGREDGVIYAEQLADSVIKRLKLKGFQKQIFARLPIKIIFRDNMSEAMIEKIEMAVIQTVRSGAYERIMGSTAYKGLIEKYKNQ